MCEYSKIKPELQIAKHDIVVYKIGTLKRTLFGLRKRIISDIFQFKYKLGKVYHTRLDSPRLGRSGDYYESRGGFHSYYFRTSISKNSSRCVIRCIIPKGSCYYRYYWVGVTTCVSNKIKLIEILK